MPFSLPCCSLVLGHEQDHDTPSHFQRPFCPNCLFRVFQEVTKGSIKYSTTLYQSILLVYMAISLTSLVKLNYPRKEESIPSTCKHKIACHRLEFFSIISSFPVFLIYKYFWKQKGKYLPLFCYTLGRIWKW